MDVNKMIICAICQKEIHALQNLVKTKVLTIKKKLYFHADCYFGSRLSVFDPNIQFDYRLKFLKEIYQKNNIKKKRK